METIREIDVNDDVSEAEYNNFDTVEELDSIQHLRQEICSEIFARQYNSDSSSGCSSKLCSHFKCWEAVMLMTVVILIWMAMSVPIILYFTTLSESNSSSSSTFNNSNYSNSSGQVCSMAQEYTGSECSSYLTHLQQCLHNNSNDTRIYIGLTQTEQKKHEKDAGLIRLGRDLFKSIISKPCQEKLAPFICLYLFPLEHCIDEGVDIIGPTQKQCRLLRDDLCKELWKNVETIASDRVPNCEDLSTPSVDLLETCEGTEQKDDNDTKLNCTQDFLPSRSSDSSNTVNCVPECQKWSPYTSFAVKITDIFIIVSASFSLISGSAVLILGCIRCKKIFSYPSIFVIYETIPLMIIAALVVVGFSSRRKLFCTSPNLISSIGNPTPFCIITGMAFHYFTIQLLVWWLCHTIAVFQGTLFPFHANHLTITKKRYFHLLMFIAGIVLPIVPVAVLIVCGKGFTLTRHPTILCVSTHKHALFATMVVPTSIIIAAGSTMLVFILWTTIKRHIEARVHKLRVKLTWIAEAKVLIILGYYLILGAAVLTILTNSLRLGPRFVEAATRYFVCEAPGIKEESSDMEMGSGNLISNSSCNREELEGLVNPIATTIAFVLLGFYPALNLVYVINIKELKEKLWGKKRKVEVVQRESSRHCSQRANIQSVILHHQSTNSTSLYPRHPSFDNYNRPSTFRPKTQVM